MTAFEINLSEITLPSPVTAESVAAPATVISSKTLSPLAQMFLFSAGEWEEFTREWGQAQKQKYHQVVRMGGANDYGVDVACFVGEAGFKGEWDNYQCKHYEKALSPSTALPEIGKILWHVFQGRISSPKNYFFVAPRDCGPKLVNYLTGKTDLKEALIKAWNTSCRKTISSKYEVELEGEFLDFIQDFDFQIFKYKSCSEMIEDHKKTSFYSTRFFQTLNAREKADIPPKRPEVSESKYLRKLNHAYAESNSVCPTDFKLESYDELRPHYNRQRESFYSAEGLKRFARDNVPKGTFENMTDDLEFSILDVFEDDSHPNGLERLKAVTKLATQLSFNANPLASVTLNKDKVGICHQLANDDRLTWVKPDE